MTLQTEKPISLTDIQAEFSAPSNARLGEFVRGGAYVPDNPDNSGVPTSKPIDVADLLGASAQIVETVNLLDESPDMVLHDMGIAVPAQDSTSSSLNNAARFRIEFRVRCSTDQVDSDFIDGIPGVGSHQERLKVVAGVAANPANPTDFHGLMLDFFRTGNSSQHVGIAMSNGNYDRIITINGDQQYLLGNGYSSFVLPTATERATVTLQRGLSLYQWRSAPNRYVQSWRLTIDQRESQGQWIQVDIVPTASMNVNLYDLAWNQGGQLVVGNNFYTNNGSSGARFSQLTGFGGST